MIRKLAVAHSAADLQNIFGPIPALIGCLLFPYIGPELLDVLFGLLNTWSWFQKETPAVGALASFRNHHSEVAILKLTLIDSSRPQPWSEPTRWPPKR